MLMYGVVWVSKKDVSVDYSKYLGPEWDVKNAKFSGAGILVSNHSGICDILVHLYLNKPIPGFLAKIETLDLPGVNVFSRNINCVYVKREADVHESKIKVMN
jgi:1-acyl-sn-glycerol-3-phosphate acyltransferase